MASVTIQLGHCFRTSGVTGGRGEQKLASEVGKRLAARLREHGHGVLVLLADEDVPDHRDIFIALHSDGSSNAAIRGASVGYPSDDSNSLHGRLAAAWKRAHQRSGFDGGFHRDNYTSGLRKYYGFGRAVGYKAEFLAEHGMHSNAQDYAWMHADYDRLAAAHVAAVGEIFGHPKNPNYIPPAHDSSDMTPTLIACSIHVDPFTGKKWTFAEDGGVFCEDGAQFHGSMGGITLHAPIVRGLVKGVGDGYILVGADGGLFHFGHVPAIQTYTPLYGEYARKERRIVDAVWADWDQTRMILVSNQGGRYLLTA